jgi:hypothetical protein
MTHRYTAADGGFVITRDHCVRVPDRMTISPHGTS